MSKYITLVEGDLVCNIPKGMTNGEVIQNIYGVMVLTVKDGKVWVEKMYFPFDEDWWNAPYQKGGEKRDKSCSTCKNNDDELSGECYECLKGMFDHYEPEEVKEESEDKE